MMNLVTLMKELVKGQARMNKAYVRNIKETNKAIRKIDKANRGVIDLMGEKAKILKAKETKCFLCGDDMDKHKSKTRVFLNPEGQHICDKCIDKCIDPTVMWRKARRQYEQT